jgi:PIN domain nuclease of toxin-antitoxin system
MKLLLDTHILLWFQAGDPALTEQPNKPFDLKLTRPM